MTPEERDRLTRVETKLDNVLEVVSSKEVHERLTSLETFQRSLAERIAWVSGAFAVCTGLVVYAAQWIYSHITIAFGSN